MLVECGEIFNNSCIYYLPNGMLTIDNLAMPCMTFETDKTAANECVCEVKLNIIFYYITPISETK